MSNENMLFTGNTPYQSIPSNSEVYSDINSSDRYLQIQLYKPLHHIKAYLLILLNVDKANIDDKGTINFEPIMYTLGWWNQVTRKLTQTWRCLGLINLDKK